MEEHFSCFSRDSPLFATGVLLRAGGSTDESIGILQVIVDRANLFSAPPSTADCLSTFAPVRPVSLTLINRAACVSKVPDIVMGLSLQVGKGCLLTPTGSKAAWQQEMCDPWLHNVIQWPKTLRFGCPHPIRLLCGRTKVQHMGQYVRSIHTVVFRVFAPTTCVTSPFTAKHRSNLKPPESDDFAWDVLANRFRSGAR